MRPSRLALVLAAVPALLFAACDGFKDDEPCVGVECDGGAGDGRSPDAGDASDATLDTGADASDAADAKEDADATLDASDANDATLDASDANDASDAADANDATTDAPVDAPGSDALVPLALALGDVHSCALLSDHTVRCWGDNSYGQLGLGFADASTDGSIPTPVPGLDHVVAIASGAFSNHTCAVIDDGGLTCWGKNSESQVDYEAGTPSAPPTHVIGMPPMGSVTAGTYHTCATQADGGAVTCWGYWVDTSFQSPSTIPNVPRPVGVPSSGTWLSCAPAGDGGLSCWGTNENLALDQPDAAVRSVKGVALPVGDVKQVSVGGATVCALSGDGSVSCWGDDGWAQTGIGSKDGGNVQAPTHVPGLAAAAEVSVGGIHACARLRDDTVACWGSNWQDRAGLSDPQVGEGVYYAPTIVDSLQGVTALASGDAHGCAILEGQRVVCWGSNDNRQLGNGGDTTYVPQPVTLE